MRGLTLRIAIAILVMLVVAAGLTTLLNFLKFEKTYSDLLRSRVGVVVLDVAATIETGLGVGLPLAELENLRLRLEGEKAKEPLILSLQVHDAQGVVLHAAGADAEASVPPDWLATLAQAGQGSWWRLEADALVVGVGVDDAIGRRVGGVVLRYDRAAYDQAMHQVLMGQLAVMAAALAVGGLVALGLVVALLKATRLTFERADEILARIIKGEPPPPPPAGPQLDDAMARFAAAAQSAMDEIESAHALLGDGHVRR